MNKLAEILKQEGLSLPNLPPGYRWWEDGGVIVLLGHGDYEVGYLEDRGGKWFASNPEDGMFINRGRSTAYEAAKDLLRWKDS